MNITIESTYIFSGINTNFCRLLCKKCDIGHGRDYPWCNEIDDYRLVFLVTINQLINQSILF